MCEGAALAILSKLLAIYLTYTVGTHIDMDLACVHPHCCLILTCPK